MRLAGVHPDLVAVVEAARQQCPSSWWKAAHARAPGPAGEVRRQPDHGQPAPHRPRRRPRADGGRGAVGLAAFYPGQGDEGRRPGPRHRLVWGGDWPRFRDGPTSSSTGRLSGGGALMSAFAACWPCTPTATSARRPISAARLVLGCRPGWCCRSRRVIGGRPRAPAAAPPCSPATSRRWRRGAATSFCSMAPCTTSKPPSRMRWACPGGSPCRTSSPAPHPTRRSAPSATTPGTRRPRASPRPSRRRCRRRPSCTAPRSGPRSRAMP